jgi:YggT family protein
MLYALLGLVDWVLKIVQYIVIAAVIANMLGINPTNPIVRALRAVAEPLYEIVRPIARRIPGNIDWSPALVLLGIELIRRFIL